MKKEDLWIIALVLALVAGILLTIFFGGNRSKHGYGAYLNKSILKNHVRVLA